MRDESEGSYFGGRSEDDEDMVGLGVVVVKRREVCLVR